MSNINVKEVLSVRKYKAGYEVRTEMWEGDMSDTPIKIKAAYTPSGEYIGDPKTADYLCKKKGIKPEKSDPEHCVCSIGFCEKDQQWYGWSHRAICGFGVGSEVKIGDCAFRPSNKEELIASLRSWYSDDIYKDVQIKEEYDRIIIDYTFGEGDPICGGHSEKVLSQVQWGRGQWRAASLEDAKQMAKDFASKVS